MLTKFVSWEFLGDSRAAMSLFKKPFKAQPLSLLKKSEARKFRDQLKVGERIDIASACLTRAPQKLFSLTDDQTNALFTAKDDVGTRNVQGTHIVLYFVNGVPLFFDPDDKERYLPTGTAPRRSVRSRVAQSTLCGACPPCCLRWRFIQAC